MARGEGEVDTRNQGVRSHFVERVVNLPMVHIAWDYAANTYSSIKESNRLVNFTLTNAERSVNYFAGQAIPVVKKFEKQIQVVDDFACKGLGTLEEKVPLITKSADEIIGDTKDLYSSTVYNRLEDIRNYGRDKVRTVTDYSLQKVSIIFNNPLVSSVVKSVDGALMITEDYIDYILPAADDETAKQNDVGKHDDEKKKNGHISRLGKISTAIRLRTYRILLVKTRNIRDQISDLKNIPPALIAVGVEGIENLNAYIKDIWVIMSSEDLEDKKIPEKFPLKQLVSVGRPIVKRMMGIFSAVLDRLQLSSPKKNEANNTANNVDHKPVILEVIDTIKGNVFWVVGLMTTSTHILPFYIYSWVSYFFPKPEVRAAEKVQEQNNSKHESNCIQEKEKEQNHVQEKGKEQNHVQENSTSGETDLD